MIQSRINSIFYETESDTNHTFLAWATDTGDWRQHLGGGWLEPGARAKPTVLSQDTAAIFLCFLQFIPHSAAKWDGPRACFLSLLHQDVIVLVSLHPVLSLSIRHSSGTRTRRSMNWPNPETVSTCWPASWFQPATSWLLDGGLVLTGRIEQGGYNWRKNRAHYRYNLLYEGQQTFLNGQWYSPSKGVSKAIHYLYIKTKFSTKVYTPKSVSLYTHDRDSSCFYCAYNVLDIVLKSWHTFVELIITIPYTMYWLLLCSFSASWGTERFYNVPEVP